MKKVVGQIKLQIPAGKATPAPPVGPALGQAGRQHHGLLQGLQRARPAKDEGLIIPVVITVYADRSYTFITKTPPVAVLIKREAGIAKGSGEPNKNKVGKITLKQVEADREAEAPRPQRESLEAAINTVKGTARSMGVESPDSRFRPTTGRRWIGAAGGTLRSREGGDEGARRSDGTCRQEVSRRPGRRWRSSLTTRCPRRWRRWRRHAFAKFDETVEVAMRLGVDPKHADQMVRGTVILPHGLGGKAKKVLVVASGEKLKEAQDAGADHVGGDDMVTKIQDGELAGLRRRRGHPRHDEVRRQAREGPRAARPHAQPQDGHRDLRRGQGRAGDQGRQGGVPRRQDGDHPRPHRQGLLRPRQAPGQRQGHHRQRAQGEAGGGQGQVREVDRAVAPPWVPGSGSTWPPSKTTASRGHEHESHREAGTDRRPPRGVREVAPRDPRRLPRPQRSRR